MQEDILEERKLARTAGSGMGLLIQVGKWLTFDPLMEFGLFYSYHIQVLFLSFKKQK